MSALKILLVEDNPVVAQGLTWQLQKHGYEVIHVSEVAGAKGAVRNRKPDLIILDVNLPTTNPESPLWDGLDFLEWMECMCMAIPVILHSSTDPLLLQQRHFNARAVAYLQKPTRLPQMLEAISAALAPSLPAVEPLP